MSREKNINLAIALKAGEYIKQNVKNVKVLYTRSSDVFVEVKERAEFANRNKADLFISIHANWASSKSVKGAETYVMGVAKDQENLEVAMKENEVILLETIIQQNTKDLTPNHQSHISCLRSCRIYS
jgi:N-acetylmuramoyl-L-alanine amidase